MTFNINKNLVDYIEANILPIYDNFDEGHNTKHIKQVVDRGLVIAKDLDNINLDIVYTVCNYHDIGMKISRKGHAIHSGTILREDEILKSFFTAEQIELMAEAVEDHSTSSQQEPRSIYGKIVKDADKDDDVDFALKRALEFTKKNYPNLTLDECIDNCYNHLVSKFGPNGLVKFYILNENNSSFIKEMKLLASNKDLLVQRYCKLEKNNK